MISVYTDADYLAAYKQKRKLFHIFMAITLVYLAFCGGWLAYYISLPYVANKFWPQAFVYVASTVYAVFAWVYLSIKYSRVRRYYKMLSYVCDGLKVGETNYFYRFREKSLQKDNIDVVGCVFETYSRKKQEWMEREVYADAEVALPEFGEGDLVRYVAQSNILIQYDILEKHAYEFEEYEEDEEYEEETQTQQGEENA